MVAFVFLEFEIKVFVFPEKDIPSHFLDEERYSKQASSSGTAVSLHLMKLILHIS